MDLALGLCLSVFGALVATDRVRRRRAPAEEAKGQSWSDRMLGQPRLGLAFVIDALAGTPGASYILGLKQLVQCNDPAGLQVVGVLLFCLIQFSPMIIPFLCLELWPEGTKTRLRALNALRGEGVDFGGAVNMICGSAAGLTSVGD